MSLELNYVPLVDPHSAYQDGLLDALNQREHLSCVLIAAGEQVLLECYNMGFAAGRSLVLTRVGLGE